MACEQCWTDASHEALMTGGSTPEIYRRLLAEREANPCDTEEQDN